MLRMMNQRELTVDTGNRKGGRRRPEKEEGRSRCLFLGLIRQSSSRNTLLPCAPYDCPALQQTVYNEARMSKKGTKYLRRELPTSRKGDCGVWTSCSSADFVEGLSFFRRSEGRRRRNGAEE